VSCPTAPPPCSHPPAHVCPHPPDPYPHVPLWCVPRFYAPDNTLVTVEQLALQHYASQEGGCWQGLHCEAGVWASLFTLLLWDVLFMGKGPDQSHMGGGGGGQQQCDGCPMLAGVI
jgi:hypothetical protein